MRGSYLLLTPFLLLVILSARQLAGADAAADLCYDPPAGPCPYCSGEAGDNPPQDEWEPCVCEYGGFNGEDHCEGTELIAECVWAVWETGDVVPEGIFLRQEQLVCQYRIRCVNLYEPDEYGLPTTECDWPGLGTCGYALIYATERPGFVYAGSCPAYAQGSAEPADPPAPAGP